MLSFLSYSFNHQAPGFLSYYFKIVLKNLQKAFESSIKDTWYAQLNCGWKHSEEQCSNLSGCFLFYFLTEVIMVVN